MNFEDSPSRGKNICLCFLKNFQPLVVVNVILQGVKKLMSPCLSNVQNNNVCSPTM